MRALGFFAATLVLVPLASGDPWPATTLPPGHGRALRPPAPRPPQGDLTRRARYPRRPIAA